MDSLQGLDFCGLRLRGAAENQRIHQLQGIEQLQDDGALAGHLSIGKPGTQPQTVNGSKTLHSRQIAGNTTVNLTPFGSYVA